MKQHQLILPLAGAIALTTTTLPALGQVVPDNSLGAESSVVVPGENINGLPSDRIDGGALRGGNLFHSFQEFNVGDGAGVYFSNPQGIDNIFSRVTGNNISNILGTLGVLGNANLFLLNPNGIFFGPNARLDVGGSFFASTANGILFDGGAEFAATNSQGAPLLTVNIPVGLQFREAPAPIEARGATLAVPPGETLGILGGDLNFQGATLTTTAGRVELGSAGGGLVNLTFGENGFALGYDGGSFPNFQNIRLAEDTVIDGGGGTIQVQGRQVSVERSKLRNVAVGGGAGGDISVSASESVTLVGVGFEEWDRLRERIFDGNVDLATEPGLYGLVGGTQGGGNAGNITVNSPSLNLASGAVILNPTFASGAAGNINVNANNIELTGSSISSLTGPGSTSGSLNLPGGAGGNIAIASNNLLLRNSSEIFAPTFGGGDGGDINIDAPGIVSVEDSLISTAGPVGSTGDSGNIFIDTGRLSVQNSSRISTTTAGTGTGGSIEIRAAESVTLRGVGAENLQSVKDSILFNETQLLTEERVNGLIAGTQGVAGSGSISVTSPSLNLESGAVIISPTLGTGDAGNINLNAGSIQTDASLISTLAALNSGGRAGNIAIATDNLLLRNSSELFAPTFGDGAGGEINIDATGAVTVENSLISTASTFDARGDAGNINIETGQLSVSGESRLSTTTSGTGAGGDINIRASESVTIAGTGLENLTRVRNEVLSGEFSLLVDKRVSGLIAGTEKTAGDSGNITVTAPTVNLTDGAVIFGPTLGRGAGGNVTVNADNLNLSASSISTPAAIASGGKAGDIEVNAQQLLLRNSSQLFAPTFGAGAGGNIAVSADRIDVENSLISAAATPEATASAGSINIDTGSLEIRGASRLSTTTSGRAAGGSMEIRAAESVKITGTGFENLRDVREEVLNGEFDLLLDEGVSGLIAGTQGKGDAGNISVTAPAVTLESGAVILSPTLGRGGGGSIAINAGNLNATSSSISTVAALGSEGRAGTIAVNAQQLLLQQDSELFAPTFGAGAGGDISANASGVTVDSSLISVAATQEATGDGGNINIETGQLTVRGRSQISATTAGRGAGGNIQINASGSVNIVGQGFDNLSEVREAILDPGNLEEGNMRFNLLTDRRVSGLIAGTQGKGDSGNIAVTAPTVNLEAGAVITSPTLGQGGGGRITVNAGNLDLNQSSISTLAARGSQGEAGNIAVNAGELLLRQDSELFAPTFGEGAGGTIEIESDRLLVDGSLISAAATQEATGDGGSINIETGQLEVRGQSRISTTTSGRGNGGDIEVRASESVTLIGTSYDSLQRVREEILNQEFNLLVDEGANGLIAGTEGKGNAGNISLTAPTMTLENGAVILSPTLRRGPGGIVTVNADSFRAVGSELSTVASAGSEGRAGEITINARELEVRDRSSINVTSQGTGRAGSINIEAERLLLENSASLTAETRAGQGDIIPNARDVVLRRDSNITTNATEEATGGNIDIDAENLISLENSDITANAEFSFGGRVIINANGIFGTEFRESETLRSDITATSELGPAFSGTIELNTPEVDPAAGLVELPQEVVDPAALIAQDPCRQGDRSEFTVTGKGGLPPDPNQSVNSQDARVDLVEPVAPTNGQSSRPPSTEPGSSSIQSARGWVRDASGDLILVSYDPTGESPARQGENPRTCR